MEEFINYINSVLPDEHNNKILFQFKREILTDMEKRFFEVSDRGVDNRQVFIDLIISEHPDLEKEYDEYYHKTIVSNKSKHNALLNAIGSPIYIIVLIASYLGISFVTQDWAHTWVMVVDGILIWISYLLSLGVKKVSTFKRVYHVFARILLALDVMVASVAVFIFSLAIIHFEASWVIVIIGIAAMFVADLIFIAVKKQKLAIINYLIYIPVISTMLFIILSYLGVFAWETGWLLIIVGILIDLVIVFATIAENKKFEKEMQKLWQEN